MFIYGKVPEKYMKKATEIMKDGFSEKVSGVFKSRWIQEKIYKLMVKNEKTICFIEEDILKGILIYKVKKGNFGIKILSVSKDCRGQGIGSKLLNFAINNCKKNNNIKTMSLEVIDTNVKAEKLYKSFFFKRVFVLRIFPLNKLFNQKYSKIIFMCKKMR